MDCNELDQKYREKFDAIYPFLFLAVLIAVASLAAGAWNAGEQDQRLKRLEAINRIDEIGRGK
jgi:hypothetical protein